MLFNSTGRLAEDFYLVGTAVYPVFLLDGFRPVLFEGGTSCAGKLYIDDIRSILGTRQPEMLLFSHAHWDHCGAIAYLKEEFPGMKVGASRRAAQILQRPGALRLIEKLSKEVRSNMDLFVGIDPSRLLDGTFLPFEVDLEIEDKQVMELGNGAIAEILATPGHTRDHHSFYLPAQKALIAGDSAGCLYNSGFIDCEFLYDYQAYLDTIKKLAALPVEIFSQGHRIVLLGRNEISSFFKHSMDEAIRFKDEVYTLLEEENSSVDCVIRRIKTEHYDILPEPKQPEIPYLLNLTAKVKHLKAMQNA